ncbi:MAG: class I SAM-dependent rRNA methyltransferase [Phycisphaerales bacterium]|nr:MAG: class I SAM-dependent rRNA methyltransferase [Phycisphaerales bacterium]
MPAQDPGHGGAAGAGGAPGAAEPAAWRFVIRADERSAALEGFSVEPAPPSTTIIREHGVRYRVDLTGGHKTGFFCDQRDNRRRFAGFCRDAAVLDCCCYSGGFGLCAKLLGGASEVTSVDLDETALALARDNANLNQTRIKHVHADAFPYLRQMHGNGALYDAIVLDPPKLALTRRDVDDALRKYHDLNVLACQVLRPGGLLLTCSCSGLVSEPTFRDVVFRAGRRAGRRLQLLAASAAAADHPVADNCPETAYLKALWLRVP